jgi:uncharacterized protein DUF6232
MRIYYLGQDAVVTSELFVRRTSPAGKFAIRDLHHVAIATGEAEGVRPGAVIALAVAAALGATAAAIRHSGFQYTLVLLVAAFVAALVGALLWQRRPRCWELQAHYRGLVIALYASSDARVFNQVSRALQRAIEDVPPPSWDDVAAA